MSTEFVPGPVVLTRLSCRLMRRERAGGSRKPSLEIVEQHIVRQGSKDPLLWKLDPFDDGRTSHSSARGATPGRTTLGALRERMGARTTRSRGAGRHQPCGLRRRVGLLVDIEVVEAGVAAVPGEIDRAALGLADHERVAMQLSQPRGD